MVAVHSACDDYRATIDEDPIVLAVVGVLRPVDLREPAQDPASRLG